MRPIHKRLAMSLLLLAMGITRVNGDTAVDGQAYPAAAIQDLLNYLMPLSIVLLALAGFISYRRRAERLRVEEALVDSEQRFRAIFEHAAIGIAKVSAAGQFLEINQAFCKIIGYTQAEVLTQSLGFQQITFPEDLESCEDMARNLLKETRQTGFMEKRYVRKDGALVWVELTVCLLKYPKGGDLCFIATVRDITRHRQAKQGLRRSEARYRLLTENMKDVIWVLDAETMRFLYISPSVERLLGYTPAELMALPAFETYTPESCERIRRLVRARAEAFRSEREGPGIYHTDELDSSRKNGPSIWLEMVSCCRLNADTGHVEIHGVTRDVSTHKKTEDALRESEFLFRSQFELGNIGIAIISPDKGWLRANPRLCQMLGYTEVELVQCSWTELSHPDDVLADKAQFERMLAAEFDSYGMDKRFIRKDGEVIHAHLTVACYRNDGQVQFAVLGLMDITERKQAEEEMKLAALLYQNSSEAMTVTDANGIILNVNPAFTQLTGYTAAEVIGKNPRILQSGRHDTAFYHNMWRAINATGHWQGEIWNKRKNGEVYAEWLSINTIFNEDGSAHRRVALFSDISEKKKSEELIWNQANFDFLTQLPNRRMFHDRLEQEIKKSSRTQLPMALLFIDLDRFKEVNDTLGHDIGDVLLKDAAQRLTSCVRDTDTVARLGGDEFTVIVGGLNELFNIERIAHTILRRLAEPFRLGEDVVYVSGSMGITFFPQDGAEIDVLLKNADQAMYDAKRLGRNRFSYFTPAMQEAAQKQMRLANDLRSGLASHQFRVFYQPIVELATGTVRTAEALVRWQHPTRGLVSPAEFIPIAEQTGMIVDIGDWVFREAASQAAHWRMSHYAEFRVSVNKSAVQFHHQGSNHSAWFDHLSRLGLPAQSIVMEITQGLLMDANAVITDQLLEFREVGMQISLDDFGSGHSTPAFLSQFKLDYIKIDESFVAKLLPGSDDLAICEAIISMAHKLDMKVVAEGVETEGQRDLLIKAGCDFGQGYLFSKPIPAEEFEQLIFQKGGRLNMNGTDGSS